MRAFLAVLLAWLCFAGSALAENRLALVIGNDDYQHIDKLLKAKADAKAYAAVLREKGFSIQEGYDLSMFDMSGAVADFVARIHPGDTAVFVYSGHGWSDGAHNYLVGVDAPDRVSQERLTRLSLPLRNGFDGVLDDFQRKNAGLKVAIIDACRDDPFRPPPGERGYALARGLKPQSVEGSFVIYSAGEGQSAMDRLSDADADPNSVFTRTLLPLLRADLPLHDAIKASQQKTHALADSAGHEQTPAYYDEVLDEACLSAACKNFAPPSPASDDVLAAIIDAQTSPDILAGMIAKLPEGFLKERAKKKLAALRESQLASIRPAPPSPGRAASDEAFAAIIDAQTNPDTLALLIAKLPEGPLKERAKKKLAALRESQVANLPPAPPVPAPTTSPAARSYEWPEGAQLVPQLDHSSPVHFLLFSPDGARIATGSNDNTIKLWDAASGRLLRTFEGHSNWVRSVAFSPDGARIASGSDDHTIKLWDAASGRLLRTFKGHLDDVLSVAFSPDGARIASGSRDGTIKLWDAASGRLLHTFEGHSNYVWSVAFSPDGARIASGSSDQTIKLWDSASGRLLRTFEGHSSYVESVAFSPDGTRIASGSSDNTIKLWDAVSGLLLRTFEGHTGHVLSVAFSPDGARIASGSEDHTIKLWDAAIGRLLHTFEGHSSNVESVAFSPDGASIASGSWESTIKLWDTASGALLATLFTYDGKGVGFTPDGLFFGDADPRDAFAIMRGSEKLPMDDFIALDRRDSLADALAPRAAAAK